MKIVALRERAGVRGDRSDCLGESARAESARSPLTLTLSLKGGGDQKKNHTLVCCVTSFSRLLRDRNRLIAATYASALASRMSVLKPRPRIFLPLCSSSIWTSPKASLPL